MIVNPTLNVPQTKFLALKTKFRGYVAGFGAGKTWSGCASQCQTSYEFPKVPLGYFAPTYPQIRDIYFPTMEEVCHNWGMRAKVNEGNKEVHIYSAGFYRTTVICRSMEKPNTIIGFKIGRALVDEIDTMPETKAENAWNKILARLRYVANGLMNGADLTTTPEGFKFTYKRFKKDPKPSYSMVQASTYDNEKYLPSDYIDSLLETYAPQLIRAYLRGDFVNLTSGGVYPSFDRVKNASFHVHDGFEPVYIGMDFNVMHMAAVCHVIREGNPHAVHEFTEVYDTPTMCEVIVDQFPNLERSDIYIYPDASARNSSSKNYAESDLAILESYGFSIVTTDKNPQIKDRVFSMNAMFCNAKGVRRYYINAAKCPKYVDALEQQVYDKNGMPDKSSGTDHVNDASGYFIVREFPIERHQFGNSYSG
jgi:hypothetical protein